MDSSNWSTPKMTQIPDQENNDTRSDHLFQTTSALEILRETVRILRLRQEEQTLIAFPVCVSDLLMSVLYFLRHIAIRAGDMILGINRTCLGSPVTINYANSTLEKAILEMNPHRWTKTEAEIGDVLPDIRYKKQCLAALKKRIMAKDIKMGKHSSSGDESWKERMSLLKGRNIRTLSPAKKTKEKDERDGNYSCFT
ncbi:hypothetical protein Tco_0356171 [Tanacetum coccineum]